MSRAAEWRHRWDITGLGVATEAEVPAVVGVLLALGALAESITETTGAGRRPALAIVLGVVAVSTTLPLALFRPRSAALAVTAASVLSLTLFHTLTVAGAAVELIVLYRQVGPGRRAGNRAQLAATGLAAPFVLLALTGGRPRLSEAAFLTVVLAGLAPAAVWAGIARRSVEEARRNRAAQEVVAGTLLEHSARGERARIARELHDVVAHHISMVAVQAETARLTTPGLPAAGAQRLSAIGDTARAALTEMRLLLGVLREDAQVGPADRRPQPGLGQLAELLDEARDAAGTGTRLILRGPPVPLDPGVELAAYRIAQEALTNARRHAPGAAVDVELIYTDRTLQVRIRDNGPGPPADAPAGGHGLMGMRERAVAVGGQLVTGPAAGGGFLVDARLPATTKALV